MQMRIERANSRSGLRSGRTQSVPSGIQLAATVILMLVCSAAGAQSVNAQVGAGGGGGGGTARTDQYFSVLPQFSTSIFMRSGTELTPRQLQVRDAAWRAEIRKQLYIPAQLPELRTRRWSTFSPISGVLADRVTYATADGMRVPAIIYRPDPAVRPYGGKLPGIVV